LSHDIGYGTNSRLRISLKAVTPDEDALSPRMKFEFDLANIIDDDAYMIKVTIHDIQMEVKGPHRYQFLGTATPTGDQMFNLGPTSDKSIRYQLELSHYTLEQIEKLRGGDLLLRASSTLIVQRVGGEGYSSHPFLFDFEIAKSKWVEKILPELGYKHVSLVEIPDLPDGEFAQITQYLNAAWRDKMMGQYDGALTNCRKALEALGKQIRSMGFETLREDGVGKRPDWKELFRSEDLGDIIGKLHQKVIGFTVPGAHAGKAINREDGDLAILTTHGLVQFAISKMKSRNEN